jgi:hypothetical protein
MNRELEIESIEFEYSETSALSLFSQIAEVILTVYVSRASTWEAPLPDFLVTVLTGIWESSDVQWGYYCTV